MIQTIKLNPETDAIAFLFSYYAGEKQSIEIAHITHIDEKNKQVGVNFLYGYKSVHEWVKFDEIVAILPSKNQNLDSPDLTPFEIKGWRGYVRQILKPEIWDSFKK